MKFFNCETLKANTVDHPYEDNPGFIAKINTFFYSKNKKAIIGYWDVPVGWFNSEVKEFSELNYIIDGAIELYNIVTGDKEISAKTGDVFLIEPGDKLKWVIRKHTKTIFFIYPSTAEIIDYFENLRNE